MYEQPPPRPMGASMSRFFRQLSHMWWVPTLLMVLLTVAGFLLSYLTYTPSYTSSGSFWLRVYTINSSGQATLANNDLTYARSLSKDYGYVLTSPDTISMVLENSDLDYNLDDVKKMVRLNMVEDSSIMELQVTSENPEMAYAVAKAYMEDIDTIINPNPRTSTDNTEVDKGDAFKTYIQITKTPKLPEKPNADTKKTLYPVLGGLAGIAIGLSLVWLFMLRMHTVQSEKDVHDYISTKMLAAIPAGSNKRRRIKGDSSLLINPKSEFAYVEAYKSLRVKVEALNAQRGFTKFMITSPLADEGKSTVAANLAIVLAQKGKSILLVDADLRKPTQHVMFHQITHKDKGLTDVLRGQVSPSDCVHHNEKYGVYLIYSGRGSDNASELLGAEYMTGLIAEMEEHFDYIIFDTPPSHVVSDALTLTAFMDATIMVIKEDFCTVETINRTIDDLDTTHAPVIGCVYNSVNKPIRLLDYYRHGYSSGYYRYNRYGYTSEEGGAAKSGRNSRGG